MNPINVLSLCDGISCAMVALQRCGIPVGQYFASEIKEHAIACSERNYPSITHIGDVNAVSYNDGVLNSSVGKFNVSFDLICFGSPCQSFSIAMPAKNRIGLEDKNKSGLFLECKRILDEVSPRYFFVENVASMRDSDKRVISDLLGVEPVRVNSSKYSGAYRDRLYWTNIPCDADAISSGSNVSLCDTFQDVVEDGWYTPRAKARAMMAGNGEDTYSGPVKLFRRVNEKHFGNLLYKDEAAYKSLCELYDEIKHGMDVDDAITREFMNNQRILTTRERERLMTLPTGYTDGMSYANARNVIGDGWTIDVIVEFFKGMTW